MQLKEGFSVKEHNMRMLIDARTFGDKPSGIGIYVYNFIKEFIKKDDIEIVLVSDVCNSEEMHFLSRHNNVVIYLFGKKTQKTFSVVGYVRYIQTIIHEVKPDIFWEPNNLFPIKLENPYGKIVVSIHDVFPLQIPKCYGIIYPIYFYFGIRNTLKYVDLILYNSKTVKRETEKYFPKATKIKSYVTYVIAELEEKYDAIDLEYFLYLGVMNERKGSDLLLKSYERYRQKGGTRSLVLAGELRDFKIRKLYEEIKDRITGIEYKGYVSIDEKHRLLANCNTFLFPTRAEGFGIPIVEAFTYKKRVITTELDVMKELFGGTVSVVSIENGEEEYIEKFANAMLEEKQVENVENVVSKYSASKLAPELYNVLQEEINENS